jgi:regulator of protease activity HflC (stomatin/prohibitin superfamily)
MVSLLRNKCHKNIMVYGEIIIGVGLILAFIFAYSSSSLFRFGTYVALLLIFIGLFFKFFVKKYDQYERAIIFRMGKFNRIAGPGWTIVIPFFEKEFARVDVRTKMMDIFLPTVFTNDDLRLKLDGVVYYKIVDPNKAVLKIDNYMNGLRNLISSQIRNLISSMSMREVFGKLPKLNDMLADSIRHATWSWGIDVPMVQLRSVTPPEEIAVAMQQKEIASQFMQAEKFRAEARKIAVEALGEAAKKLDDRALTYLYIKALEDISKSSGTKLVFPAEFMSVMKRGFGLGTGISAAGIDENQAVEAIKKKILSS